MENDERAKTTKETYRENEEKGIESSDDFTLGLREKEVRREREVVV